VGQERGAGHYHALIGGASFSAERPQPRAPPGGARREPSDARDPPRRQGRLCGRELRSSRATRPGLSTEQRGRMPVFTRSRQAQRRRHCAHINAEPRRVTHTAMSAHGRTCTLVHHRGADPTCAAPLHCTPASGHLLPLAPLIRVDGGPWRAIPSACADRAGRDRSGLGRTWASISAPSPSGRSTRRSTRGRASARSCASRAPTRFGRR